MILRVWLKKGNRGRFAMQSARKPPSAGRAAESPVPPAPGHTSMAPFLLQTLSKLLSVISSILMSRLFGLPSHILAAAIFYLPALQTMGLFVMKEALRRVTSRPVSDLSVLLRAANDEHSPKRKASRPTRSDGARRLSPERAEGSSLCGAGSLLQCSSLCSSLNLAYLGSFFSILFSLGLAAVGMAVPPTLRGVGGGEAASAGPVAGRSGEGTHGTNVSSFAAQSKSAPFEETTRALLEAAETATLWSYRLAVLLFFFASAIEAAAEPLLTRVLLQGWEPGESGADAGDAQDAAAEKEEETARQSAAAHSAEGRTRRGVGVEGGKTRQAGRKGRRGESAHVSRREQETSAVRAAETACRHRALAEAAATVSKTLTILCLMGVFHFLRRVVTDFHLNRGTACGAETCESPFGGRTAAAEDRKRPAYSSHGETGLRPRQLVLCLTGCHPLLAFGAGQIVYSLVWFILLARAAGMRDDAQTRRESEHTLKETRSGEGQRWLFFPEMQSYLTAIANLCTGKCSCSGSRCKTQGLLPSTSESQGPGGATPPAGSRRLFPSPTRPTRSFLDASCVRCVLEIPQRARERFFEAATRLTIPEHRWLLQVSFGLIAQKFLGVEGEKLVLLALLTPDAAGEYAFVSGAASIVPRLLFAPVEEAAFTAFCSLHASSTAPLGSLARTETLEPNAPELQEAPRDGASSSALVAGRESPETRDSARAQAQEGGSQRVLLGNAENSKQRERPERGQYAHSSENSAVERRLMSAGLRCRSGRLSSKDRQTREDETPPVVGFPARSDADEGEHRSVAPFGEDVEGSGPIEPTGGVDVEILGPAAPLLRLLLTFEGTLGLVAATCGPVFARAAVHLVYGPRWGNCPGAVAALQVYSVYILLMAVFGLLDAHALATAPPEMLRLLRRLKGWSTAFHLIVSLPTFVFLFPERQAAAVIAAQCLFTFLAIAASLFPFAYRLASAAPKASGSLEALCVVRHFSSSGLKSAVAAEASGIQLAARAKDAPRAGRDSVSRGESGDWLSRWGSFLSERSTPGRVEDAQKSGEFNRTPTQVGTQAENVEGARESAEWNEKQMRLARLLPLVLPAALMLLPPSPLSLILPILVAVVLSAAGVAVVRRAAQKNCSEEPAGEAPVSAANRPAGARSETCRVESSGGESGQPAASCLPEEQRRMRHEDWTTNFGRENLLAEDAGLARTSESRVVRLMGGPCIKEWRVEVLLGAVVASGLLLTLAKPFVKTLTLLRASGGSTQLPLLGSLAAVETSLGGIADTS